MLDERSPAHLRFNKIYTESIAPMLASLESKRVALRLRTIQHLRFLLFFSAGVAVLIFILASSGNRDVAILPVVAGAGAAVA